MGLALENFDAVGSWRTLDEGQPIDASGVLPGWHQGERRRGPARSLDRYSTQFVQVVAEKLLTYAIGRGTEDEDMPMVRAIFARRAARRLPVLVAGLGIVKSDMFRMNQKAPRRTRHAARRRGNSRGQTSVMFLTKKHIPRRTVLRGAGAMLALPLLDAMVPAATAWRRRPRAPKPRFVGLLRAARHGPGLLGAGDGRRAGRGTPVQLEAARAVREHRR